ncbi:ArsR/SmtB family transcription factor [Psychromicrobium lacuslunae]|uniref:ArsR family transcriptional regulator n=1 Tax=Psychromicrobium lacuslunae TaxID=1618207 RepID=A0A0D4C032_9MICC|nr:metalloregulator ArsR/SmtB family transcription factor [Psychromicrobium lacuslunae]AJT41934.1 ArsR family transcriptional regulator [Psychromicrobium lacuslunae]
MVNEDVFAVLAEQTRRDILLALRSGQKAVGELVEQLGASQPTVSKHLRVLREAGLVSMRAEGQRRYYQLETAPLHLVVNWLDAFGLGSSGSADEATASSDPVAATEIDADADSMPQQIGRSVGRAATKAADLLANLPKFGRRKD